MAIQNLSLMTSISNRPCHGNGMTNNDDTIGTNGTMKTLDIKDIETLVRDENENKGREILWC